MEQSWGHRGGAPASCGEVTARPKVKLGAQSSAVTLPPSPRQAALHACMPCLHLSTQTVCQAASLPRELCGTQSSCHR